MAAGEVNPRGIWSGFHRARKPWHLLVLPCCLLLLPLVACGLDTVPFVDAPIAYSAGGNTVTTPLQLDHNSLNSSSSFRGYSLYYRCYDTLADADAARTAIENLAAATNALPLSIFNSLRYAYQFRHLVYQTTMADPPDPVFAVPSPTAAISYFLSMKTNADWTFRTMTNGISDASPIVCRDVPGSNGAFPPLSFFSSDFTKGDLDYAGNTYFQAGLNPNGLYIVIFAVGFGFDASSTSFSLIPSLPASFGYSMLIR